MPPDINSLVFTCRILPAVFLALLALLIRKSHHSSVLPWMFLALATALTAYLFSYGLLTSPNQAIVYGSLLLMIPLPYLAHLIAKISFEDGFNLGMRHGVMLGGIVISQILCFTIFRRYVFVRENSWEELQLLLSMAIPMATSSALTISILRVVTRDWRSTLIEPRRRLAAIVLIATAALVLISSGGEVMNILLGNADRRWSTATTAGAANLAILMLCVALLEVPEGLLEPHKAAAHLDPGKEPGDGLKAIVATIEKAMQEGAYLDERMSIAGLAAKVGIPQYKVRSAINTTMGFRNFNQYLNLYRIKAASERLADPSNASLKILAIALEVGFNSLAPFNKAFKEVQGVTPSDYRRLAQENSGAAPSVSNGYHCYNRYSKK